jgi:1,4-alpha-glucan branching enzyme/maltooligosyltrehalose trehalohydrolase
VHTIFDMSETYFMLELACRVRAQVPREVHLILENERNRAALLQRDPVLGRRPFEAQWNDDFHHAAHVALTGERAGYYGDYADRPVDKLRRALAEGFVYQGEPSAHGGGAPRGEPSAELPPTAFVDFLQNHDQIGNRALGERLSALAPAEAVRTCQALLLLAPQVPLLFMGEEWGSRTPFLFFCDFAGELADRVRAGRRDEFAAQFADRGEVPDPLDPETFARSRLDWSELDEPEHAAWLDETRELLRLRAERIAPHLVEGEVLVLRSAPFGPHGLSLAWRLAGDRELHLAANLGSEPAIAPIPPGEPLYATHPGWSGAMPPWSLVWTMGGE